jgi:hypothetical protein
LKEARIPPGAGRGQDGTVEGAGYGLSPIGYYATLTPLGACAH